VNSGDRGDVEAHRAVAIVGGQPLGGQQSQPALLGRSDGCLGRAEAVRGPGLDLAEDDERWRAGDQVELAGGRPPVAVDDLVAVRRVPPRREIFTPTTAGLVGQRGLDGSA